MAKNKEEKKQIINNLVEKINRAKSIIFIGFKGLKVKDNEALRNLLRQEDNEYCVVKKTLLDLSLKEAKYSDVNINEFNGQTAVVFGYEDEVAPAKIINKFNKELDPKTTEIEFSGGILDKKFISKSIVSELSILPSKPELHAKIVGSINAPISNFVNTLAGNIRNLVYALSAIKDTKE